MHNQFTAERYGLEMWQFGDFSMESRRQVVIELDWKEEEMY